MPLLCSAESVSARTRRRCAASAGLPDALDSSRAASASASLAAARHAFCVGRSGLRPVAPLGQTGKLRRNRRGTAAELVGPSTQLHDVLDPRGDLCVALFELPCVVEPRIHSLHVNVAGNRADRAPDR